MWFCLFITSGAMYPGVPEVSLEFYSLNSQLIPKSAMWRYPFVSKTKFSGLMSLWMMFFEWICSSPNRMHAIMNSQNYTELTQLRFAKSSLLHEMISQIPSPMKIHYKKQVAFVLKSTLHIDNKPNDMLANLTDVEAFLESSSRSLLIWENAYELLIAC